jgi:hypothetical protein
VRAGEVGEVAWSPARQRGARSVDRSPVADATSPHPQERDLGGKSTWVTWPRWYDGKDHLALDTGGGRWRACGA